MTTSEQADRRLAHWYLAALLTACFLVGVACPARAQDPQNGSIASVGGSVAVPLLNVPSTTLQLSGTWAGSAAIQFTIDGGATWWPLPATTPADGSNISVLTANGVVMVQNVGYTSVRVVALTLASGTITVTATKGFGGSVGSTVVKGVDSNGVTRAIATDGGGVLVPSPPRSLRLPCNALRLTNCQ